MVKVILEVGVRVRVTVRHVVGVVCVRELLQATRVHNSYPTNGDISFTYLLHNFIYIYTIFDQCRVDIIDQVEYGVHDWLHIYPLCGIFYFPWHRHQIEGTNGF